MSLHPPKHTIFGLPKLPTRYAALVMPFLLSALMTCIVSLTSTLIGVGLTAGFTAVWFSSWMVSWLIAFPTLLVALPLVRRVTAAIVDTP